MASFLVIVNLNSVFQIWIITQVIQGIFYTDSWNLS
jgi:hypothetical protein